MMQAEKPCCTTPDRNKKVSLKQVVTETFFPLFEGIWKSTEPGSPPSNAHTESQKSQPQLC